MAEGVSQWIPFRLFMLMSQEHIRSDTEAVSHVGARAHFYLPVSVSHMLVANTPKQHTFPHCPWHTGWEILMLTYETSRGIGLAIFRMSICYDKLDII